MRSGRRALEVQSFHARQWATVLTVLASAASVRCGGRATGVAAGADAGSGPDGATLVDAAPFEASACVAVPTCSRQQCSSASHCCSGRACGHHGTCANLTGSCCGTSVDCLSDACLGGACACSPPGGLCVSNADCCDGVPCENGTCCNRTGRPCSQGSDCCNGSCTAGRCDCASAYTATTGDGPFCVTNADCCNDQCGLFGDAGWGNCTPGAVDAGCMTNGDCAQYDCVGGHCACSGVGQPTDPVYDQCCPGLRSVAEDGGAVCRCQPLPGAYCVSDADCCSGVCMNLACQ